MSESTPSSPTKTVTSLNATELSRSVLTLFQEAKVTPEPGSLILAELARWAVKHPPADPTWTQAVESALAGAETDDPQAMYENLAEALTGDETTLQEAGHAMVAYLADLITADQQAA